jgi:four helix bundle protein
MSIINDFRQLKVYQRAFDMSEKIFELTKTFPKEETYSLIDQIRRSSRSVCANITEAHRRRIYPKSLASRLIDSEAEAAETQHWLDSAFKCKYINQETYQSYRKEYDIVIGILVCMRRSAHKWDLEK